MNNPFSNRSTTTSGEYLQKKKAISKIAFIKMMPWRNFKTRDYIVKGNVRKSRRYEKAKYPEEPHFPAPPVPYPTEFNDLFYTNDSKDYVQHIETTKKYEENVYTNEQICKKCSNSLMVMNPPPQKWTCDCWSPPDTYCESGNGKEFGRTDKAFSCPNFKYCKWIICEKCYISLGKKVIKKKERLEYQQEYFEDVENWDKILEEERRAELKKDVMFDLKCAPTLKCIRGHREYLDLAKGFHLTQPFCENTYQNTCENNDCGKLVNNISEARYSVLDMGKSCLYDQDMFMGAKIKKNGPLEQIDIVHINKCRLDKGLLNLRGTVEPKLKTEHILKFPITLKKTEFCNKIIKHGEDPEIHNINPNKPHVHWFPTKNRFIKYGHKHNERPHKSKFGAKAGTFPAHMQPNRSLQFSMSQMGKKTVLIPPDPKFRQKQWARDKTYGFRLIPNYKPPVVLNRTKHNMFFQGK
jgi:hypothetical protein